MDSQLCLLADLNINPTINYVESQLSLIVDLNRKPSVNTWTTSSATVFI
jgi:hypothetical protein